MVDIVFKRRNGDEIADLLHSWTIGHSLHTPPDTCAEMLVCLHNLVPFSSRLRGLVILSVELVRYDGFEGVGMERLIELLNHLHVAVEDMVELYPWVRFLAEILETSEGTQLLSHWYWELLVELAILWPLLVQAVTCNPQTTIFLTEAQEWSKLECWIATIWVSWSPEAGGITEEDLSRSMLLLFRQRPGALQKLEQWMERSSQEAGNDTPESFQRICKQAQEAAQQDTPWVSFRIHLTYSGSHEGVCFVLDQLYLPELKNLTIRHRPYLLYSREAVGSGNRCRTVPSRV